MSSRAPRPYPSECTDSCCGGRTAISEAPWLRLKRRSVTVLVSERTFSWGEALAYLRGKRSTAGSARRRTRARCGCAYGSASRYASTARIRRSSFSRRLQDSSEARVAPTRSRVLVER
jgi:hypothetical protein